MSKEIRCTVTDEEFDLVEAYIKRKGRWAKMPHFVRWVIFTELERGRPGAHHAVTGGKVGRPPINRGKDLPATFGGNLEGQP
jgi:hypothetical protein